MAAKERKLKERTNASVSGIERWYTGAAMLVLASVMFMTAIGFDTRLQGTFDLSKLVYLYGAATVLLAGWAIRSLKTGELVVARTPLDLPVAATALITVLATIFAVDWRCSLFGAYKNYEGAVQILIYLLLFYVAARLRRSEVIVVIATIVAAAFGGTLYGLVQRLGMDTLGWSKWIEGRVISTFGNPVFFGLFLVLAVPLAVGLAMWRPKNRPKDRMVPAVWVCAMIATAVFTMSVYPAVQHFRQGDPLSSPVRASVLVVAAVALSAVLGRQLLLRRRGFGWHPWMGWFNVVLVFTISAGFYCSKSVGALMALGVGLVFMLGFLALQREALVANRKMVFTLAAGLLVINLGFNLWPETSVVNRLSGLIIKGTPKQTREVADGTGGASGGMAPAGSFFKRTLLFRSGINIVKEYPLLGVGPDGIERVIAKQWSVDYQLDYGRLVQVEGFENRVHNELIEVAATQGLLGLGARLWLWAAVGLMLWRARRRLDPGDHPVLAGLAASWVVLVAAMVFEYPTIPISAATWVILGCLVAWIQNDSDAESHPVRRVSLGRFAGAATIVAVIALAVVIWFWQAVAINDYVADQHYMNGEILTRSKRNVQAVAQYKRAFEMNPYQHVYSEKLNAVMLGLLSTKKGPEREAWLRDVINITERTIEVAPWRANSYAIGSAARGQLIDHLSGKQRPDDAPEIAQLMREREAGLEKAVEANHFNAGLRTARARHFLRMKRWHEFCAEARQTLAWWPVNKPMSDLVVQGVSMMVQDRAYDEARSLINDLEEAFGRHRRSMWLYARGRVLWADKQWNDLEATALEMIEMGKLEADAQLYLTVAHAQKREFHKADKACRRLLELRPDDAYGKKMTKVISAILAKSGAVQVP